MGENHEITFGVKLDIGIYVTEIFNDAPTRISVKDIISVCNKDGFGKIEINTDFGNKEIITYCLEDEINKSIEEAESYYDDIMNHISTNYLICS